MFAHPLHAWLLLWRPDRIHQQLQAIAQSGRVAQVPNLWQIETGVLRFWHRVLFRFDTIGTTADHPVRATRRARFLEPRWRRGPFLVAHGAVRPWDLTGLVSTPGQLVTHLVGTHHDGVQFVYDLQILACHPGRLQELRATTVAILEGHHPQASYRRDLCVYERYHEDLLATVDRALAGDLALSDADARNPDITFYAWLQWCANQPKSPVETFRAWRAGQLDFGPGLLSAAPGSPTGSPGLPPGTTG